MFLAFDKTCSTNCCVGIEPWLSRLAQRQLRHQHPHKRLANSKRSGDCAP